MQKKTSQRAMGEKDLFYIGTLILHIRYRLKAVCENINMPLRLRFRMPYNCAIVHECVRHFMGRTFGVPHRALRDTKLAGYRIPEVRLLSDDNKRMYHPRYV